MQVNDEFILDIKRLGINGEGIGFYKRMAVFVKNAIPGEGVNVRVTDVKNNMAFAEVIEYKHVSEDRKPGVNPDDYIGLQCSHIKYEAMLKYKREALMEALTKYSGLNPRSFQINNTVPSPKVDGYRNRSLLPVKFGKDMHMHVCMMKPNSNIMVEVEDNIDQDPLINKLNKLILKETEDLRVKAYNEKYNDGLLKYISIRVNEAKEAMVTFIVKEKDPVFTELAKRVIMLEGVKSIYLNIAPDQQPGQIFGDKTELLEGKPYITLQLDKLKYQVYPKTFFQLNTLQAKNMFDLIKKACKLSFKERVLDAYCGVGAISLYLAHNAKEVIGIEYNQDSVDAAKENAKLNKISNATFYQGDAGELMLKKIREGEKFDIIVVDPPRQGLDDKFISAILESDVKRVVYGSCNPQTLAKNLKRLSEKYNVKSITPLDMFPNTPLVESVTLLELKKDKTAE